MLISDFAIKRPLVTVVAMLALVVFGIFALIQLQTDEFPDVQQPIVLTQIIYPGASPEQVEREILEQIEEAILLRIDPSEFPIVQLALFSKSLSPAQLSRLADPGITRELRSINGVGQVNVLGNVERQLVVELRPSDLQANGVSVADVVQALQLQNLAAPVGRIE